LFFLNGDISFLALTCLNSLYVLDINSVSEAYFANVLSHSVGCVYPLSIVPFPVLKLCDLIQSQLSHFTFVACDFQSYPNNHCPHQDHGGFLTNICNIKND
jgi:hypothetical protein